MRRLWIAALVAAAVRPALGQTVRGAVIADGNPVGGIVVTLVDSTSREVGRALTDARGEYRLTAPKPGTYRLRTLRIGFQSLVTEPTVLAAGSDVTRQLAVSTLPLALDTIRATGRNACNVVAGDSTSLVAKLWDQARNALIATQLSLSNNLLYTTAFNYHRMLDARSQRVGRQTHESRSGFAKQPWTSLSADSLRRAGYVFTRRDSARVYNSPDLSVLLSDAFVEDHCFRISKASDDQRLGIDFEPTPARRDVSEIRGTLWLDRRTNELQALEHRYVNRVRSDEERIARAEMKFTRLQNGVWTVSGWSIHMPVPVVVPVRSASFSILRYDTRIDSIQVTGSELVLATTTGTRRDTIWMRQPASQPVTLFDSLMLQPAPAAPAPAPQVEAPRINPKVAMLDSMVTHGKSVEPHMEEFEQHRKRGLGKFLTRADIERRAGASTASLLTGMPSLRILSAQGGEWAYNAGQRCSATNSIIPLADSAASACMTFYKPTADEARRGVTSRCYAKVYVDRALMNSGTPTPPYNLREITPSEIEAIEYYSMPAEIPVKYNNMNSACGLIIIHTRR